MLSAQNQLWRTTGENITIKLIKKADYSLLSLFENRYLKMAFKANLDVINLLNKQIHALEKTGLGQTVQKPEYQYLQTINGVGPILAMTILLETGDINRFAKVGNYSSSCRCVQSTRISN